MTRDLQAEARAALPVTVLTGFLGSGKTTLLAGLLAHPGLGETAVLINELGEAGLDHLLVRQVAEDVVLLASGCLCCSVRGDMITALRDLFLKRVRGEIPEFQRVVIETTGLADPAPILHTLMTDPLLGTRYRLDGVVTTVDALTGAASLDAHAEAVKQVAVADRLVLTKTDLAAAAAIDALKARLAALNPAAPLLVAVMGRADPALLFEAGLFTGRDRRPDVARWLKAGSYGAACCGHDHHGDHRHDCRIQSFVLTRDTPVSWPSLAAALDLLIAARGEGLLRIKGIVNTRDTAGPVVVHGVQHVFHPPVELPAWPDADHRTRLVFITRDLPRSAVEAVLGAVLGDESESF